MIQYSFGRKKKYYEFPNKLDAFSFTTLSHKKEKDLDFSFSFFEEDCEFQETRILYRENEGWFYWEIFSLENDEYLWRVWNEEHENYLAFRISNNWRKFTVIKDLTKTNGMYAFEYFGKIFPYAVLNYDAFVIHGVLMEYDGKGIIISAPSGTGKTTHVRMWRDMHRALIINGDRSLCKKKNDIWTGFGMPWCGTSGEYINREIPINAIVVLQRGEENQIKELTKIHAFQHMFENIVVPQWDSKLMNNAIDMFEDMIKEIPVFLLTCRPDEEAVEVLRKEIDKR